MSLAAVVSHLAVPPTWPHVGSSESVRRAVMLELEAVPCHILRLYQRGESKRG